MSSTIARYTREVVPVAAALSANRSLAAGLSARRSAAGSGGRRDQLGGHGAGGDGLCPDGRRAGAGRTLRFDSRR